MGRDLLKHCQPLARNASFVLQQAREISARSSQARDESRSNWVRHAHKYDWNCTSLLLHGGGDWRCLRDDQLRVKPCQLFREGYVLSNVSSVKAIINVNCLS